jgi:hypothetical protein
MTIQPPPTYNPEHVELSERTATYLGFIPGLGCVYARKNAAACWFAAVAAVELLVLLLAFPKGGLTGFGLFAVGFLQVVAFIVWGGSVVAGRRHVRRANQG